MTVDSIWMAIAALMLALFVGAVIGAVVAIVVYDRGARLGRTGSGSAAPRPRYLPGGEFKESAGGQSVENEAATRAYEKVVERGADEIMALEPQLTRDQARAKARHILAETGAFNATGGLSGV